MQTTHEIAAPAPRRVARAKEAATATEATYYGVPMLQPPVWKWMIPAYFYVGGATGASLALGAAAQLTGDRELEPLVRRCRIIGVIGAGASAALLVADLGRPGRFISMLRVFRATSPMSVGSWLLTGVGAASAAALLLPAPRARAVATLAAGLLGVPLSGYTGVLLANTAVPAWQQAGRALPPTFMASAVASAGSLFEMVPRLPPRARRAVRSFAVAGKSLELLGERFVGATGPSVALTAGSLALSLLGGRRGRVAAGLLGTLGALALRFAVMRAGRRSTEDPRVAFAQQR